MNKQPEKPTVHYDASKGAHIYEGFKALVYPIDHTSEWVSNTKMVTTSKVIRHDVKSGEFETMNTIYKPMEED